MKVTREQAVEAARRHVMAEPTDTEELSGIMAGYLLRKEETPTPCLSNLAKEISKIVEEERTGGLPTFAVDFAKQSLSKMQATNLDAPHAFSSLLFSMEAAIGAMKMAIIDSNWLTASTHVVHLGADCLAMFVRLNARII